jgi:hypothetical protein
MTEHQRRYLVSMLREELERTIDRDRLLLFACFLRYCLLSATDQLILMVRRRVADLWRHARASADRSAPTGPNSFSSCSPIWNVSSRTNKLLMLGRGNAWPTSSLCTSSVDHPRSPGLRVIDWSRLFGRCEVCCASS